MAIQRISEVEGEPQIGRFYLVPCIPLVRESRRIRLGWWPVLLPVHGDAELGFPWPHYHYDWRFVSKCHYRDVVKDHEGVESWIYSTVAAAGYGHGEIDERPMKCKRRPPTFPSHNPNGKPNRLVRILEPLYQDKRLSACLRCPHRGMDLSQQPVRDGKVICPGHGLQFNVETGEMVSRLKS